MPEDKKHVNGKGDQNLLDSPEETDSGMMLSALADGPEEARTAMYLNSLVDGPEELKKGIGQKKRKK